jgi:hypothetical protein
MNPDKLVTNSQNFVTNSEIYREILKLVTHSRDQLTNLDNNLNLSELVTELQKIVTNLRVVKNKTKAGIIFTLLLTKTCYYRAFSKILNAHPELLRRSINDLLNVEIIEEVPPNEMLKEKEVFKTVIRKKTKAGEYHTKKAKFYRLTPFYEEIFSRFIEDLSSSLDDETLERIYNFQKIIRLTHKQIEKQQRNRSDLLEKRIEDAKLRIQNALKLFRELKTDGEVIADGELRSLHTDDLSLSIVGVLNVRGICSACGRRIEEGEKIYFYFTPLEDKKLVLCSNCFEEG